LFLRKLRKASWKISVLFDTYPTPVETYLGLYIFLAHLVPYSLVPFTKDEKNKFYMGSLRLDEVKIREFANGKKNFNSSCYPDPIRVGMDIVYYNFKMAADLSATEKETLEALLQVSFK